ncbi:hypothetical protein VKT23_016154 [Stygiomarasmius scandens]|uniref:Uncharacterized protein n=1 Tax=Marasmiellus scandens TaxID=2682957 RepID=A0ABR1IW72_9AGAR
MDIHSLPYRRIITYSKKHLRRLGPNPVSSDNLGQDRDCSPEPAISNNSEENEVKNKSEENEAENKSNDVLKAQDELRKSLIKALSCPICLELSTPPCM